MKEHKNGNIKKSDKMTTYKQEMYSGIFFFIMALLGSIMVITSEDPILGLSTAFAAGMIGDRLLFDYMDHIKKSDNDD